MKDRDRNMPNPAADKSKAEGERWESESDTVERRERNSAFDSSTPDEGGGITNRPLKEETENRSKWTGRNHRMSEMSRLLTGEELPYATLMYVWANHDAPETVIVNARTDRIRKVVVESGAQQVGHWRDYQRNIRADFFRAFGEEPGPLRAVAIMTDTDNTQSSLRAWYGRMTLTAR